MLPRDAEEGHEGREGHQAACQAEPCKPWPKYSGHTRVLIPLNFAQTSVHQASSPCSKPTNQLPREGRNSFSKKRHQVAKGFPLGPLSDLTPHYGHGWPQRNKHGNPCS